MKPWSALRSWIVGLAPTAGRFFFYWFLIFWFHQFSVSLFRLTGVALRPLTLANAGAVFVSMVLMTFGAYIQPKGTIPGWYIWVRAHRGHMSGFVLGQG